MKKNMIFSGAMSWMTALLLCTACSSDDVATDKAAAAVPEGKVIHYTATVGEGDETRATLNSDKKYEYQVGDKLVITGTDISGELTLATGAGTASATFSGDLTYTGEGTPADDLELKAVLVSTSNAMTTLTYDAAEYPTGAIASTLADAVQKYSHFTATSTYSSKSFSLSQQTSFLNFTVTFGDGTSSGDALNVTIKNGGETVRTGSVTAATDANSKVVAQFVAAMPKGTTMSSATVQLGTKSAIAFGGTTTLVANKIYNITKTIEAAYITGNVGQVICSDGTVCNYADKGSKTVVAVIVYNGSATGNSTYNHGLALALFDANGGNATTDGTSCKWKTSTGSNDNSYQTTFSSFASEDGSIYISTRNNSTWPAFQACISYSGGTAPTNSTGWFLPSAYQWNQMVSGVGSYSTLRDYFSSRGGRNMQSSYSWSCTEYDTSDAWGLDFSNGNWYYYVKTSTSYVRACFAF